MVGCLRDVSKCKKRKRIEYEDEKSELAARVWGRKLRDGQRCGRGGGCEW